MSKPKKFSLDQVVDPSNVTVTDVGLLSLNIDKSIRVDEFPSKLSFISNLSVSFYMHLGHSLGFVTSVPVILRVEDFTDDYLSALDNVRLNNASLEVIDEPTMIFFTFDREDLVDCASLFELGSLESNFDSDNDRFLLTPKSALASELMSLVQSKLNIEDIDSDNEANLEYDTEFFDSLKKCLIEDLSLLHEESAVHVADISSVDEISDESPEIESKALKTKPSEYDKPSTNLKNESKPVESKNTIAPETKETSIQEDDKVAEKKESVKPGPKKEVSATRSTSKSKTIKDPSVSNPLAAASAIIDKKEEPDSIHDDLFSINDPKDISDDISAIQEPFDGLREPDGY